jgi:UPF0176 protein
MSTSLPPRGPVEGVSVPPQPASDSILRVATFYKFVPLPDREERTRLRNSIREFAAPRGILGTILLAEEGINGTVAGRIAEVEAVLVFLRSDERFADLEAKDSVAGTAPFYRLRVRLKNEIVTMGRPDLDPSTQAGTYVPPEAWNDLIDQAGVVLIDARNDYETVIGAFEGAVDPRTESFRELPQWLREYQPLENKPPVAMYCTGGIRCEKATAFLRSEGFEEIYHLQGGILKYLEVVPPEESRWRGECFVFDQRVSVGPGLELGTHDLCHACRWPVSDQDRRSEFYLAGVSCPRCHDQWTPEQRERFANRQRQMELAEGRADKHLGQVFSHQQSGVVIPSG